MAMNKTAKLMMMSNGHGRNQYDYDEEEHKPEKYKENHNKSIIRAGGNFWMEDPRVDKKMEFDHHAA